MNAIAPIAIVGAESPALLELGTVLGRFERTLAIDLNRLLSSRLLIQGSSGAGKSWTVRRLVEEAFEYVTCMIVDPEGEFGNLAEHIGATTLRGCDLSAEGLTAAALRARHHRIPLHVDLSDLEPDERVAKAAAFHAGLLSAPREDWSNTILVAIDEAHLLAPHLAASARDAETRRLGVATLTELCSRGRKRGIVTVIATQRLAKLAGSVTSELHNALIGLSVFDRDIVRAKDFLGFGAKRADDLRALEPGTFYAIGPAISRSAILVSIGETATLHLGQTPTLTGPADLGGDQARSLLDLEGMAELHTKAVVEVGGRGRGALDGFLMHPLAAAATRILDALRRISPNATTSLDLAAHLGLEPPAVEGALDLLAGLAAVDTTPRDEQRICRLSARLRLRIADIPVVGLS